MKTKEALVEARKLISNPANWTKNAFARNKHGDLAKVTSPTATCFCFVGAVTRVDPKNISRHMRFLRAKIAPNIPPKRYVALAQAVYNFNDNASHSELLAKIDELIAECPE